MDHIDEEYAHFLIFNLNYWVEEKRQPTYYTTLHKFLFSQTDQIHNREQRTIRATRGVSSRGSYAPGVTPLRATSVNICFYSSLSLFGGVKQ